VRQAVKFQVLYLLNISTMKAAYSFLVLTASLARACVVAHIESSFCVFEGDRIQAQVWDNAAQVCTGGAAHSLSTTDTEWCIKGCRPGYSFCVYDNGSRAVYTHGDYRVEMLSDRQHKVDRACGNMGDRREIKGWQQESCMSDHHPSCNPWTSLPGC
jgi:hypothetical protein